MRALIRLRDGKIDDAIVDLRTGLAETPRSIPINLILAEAYERSGQDDLAKENLAFVAEESDYDPAAAKPYVEFLLRHKEFDRAEKVLGEVLSRYPEDTATIATLASVKLHNGDWEGAKALAASARQQGDDTGAAIRRDNGGGAHRAEPRR